MLNSHSSVVGLLLSVTVIATAKNQHLICKSVHDVFSEDDSRQTGYPQNATQGFPGKRGPGGPPGRMGMRGLRGEPGHVDYVNISNIIEQKVEEGLAKLHNQVFEVTKNITIVQEDIRRLECSSPNLRYKNICYSIHAVTAPANTNRARAIQACNEAGANLAEIHDRIQQKVLEEYLHSRMPSSSNNFYVWTGMTYNSGENTLLYKSGKKVTTSHLVWWPGYPNSDYGQHMLLEVSRNLQRRGVWNYADRNSFGALCEKEV